MTRISILPLAEPGHVNATIRLGRELMDTGHDVRYCGAPVDAPLFAARGVAFHALPRVLGRYGPEYDWRGDPSELALVDSILYRPTIDAHLAGKRVVSLSTTFPLGYDPELPPVTSMLAPPRDEHERAEVAAAWRAEHDRHARVVPNHAHNYRTDSTLAILRGFATSRGWPRERLDERAAINPVARLPELVLAPAQLDLPRAAGARHYGGPCINLERAEPAFPWERLRAGRPMIYASFGTQGHRYPLPRALGLLLAAARALPELDVVVATGPHPVSDVPANAICVPEAPQLALLQRAALAISHGGLNGLKEALYFGVPILVLPFAWDQPGNAARIAFHRLGRAARWDDLTAEALAAALRSMLGDETLRGRVASFAAELQRDHAQPLAARALAELTPLRACAPELRARVVEERLRHAGE
ncbi:MAG: glycosyltransferase [Kofleriaceae bacterium]